MHLPNGPRVLLEHGGSMVVLAVHIVNGDGVVGRTHGQFSGVIVELAVMNHAGCLSIDRLYSGSHPSMVRKSVLCVHKKQEKGKE